MKKALGLFVLVMATICLSGCSPDWLSVSLDFYGQDNSYLHSVEITQNIQLVAIPQDAAFMNVVFSARKNSGERLPFDYLFTGVDNADGFEYPLAHGHMANTDEEIVVPKLLRYNNGAPVISEFQAVIEVDYSLTNLESWSTLTIWKDFASFKAVPEELLDKQQEQMDRGGVQTSSNGN